MLKKTIEFIDYNGNKRKEDHYFNLTKAEIMEMEMSTKGGLTEMINNIIAAQDAPAIMKVFKDLIFKAYGKKSADGREFEKSPEIVRSFEHTEAYSELFMELVTDPEKAAEFFNGIVPADLAKQVQKEMAENPQLTTI